MRYLTISTTALLAFALATPAQAQKESDILKVQQVIANIGHLPGMQLRLFSYLLKGHYFIPLPLIEMFDPQTLHTQGYHSGVASGDDSYLDTCGSQHLHAVTIFGIEDFVFLAIIAQYQAAVGQYTVHIKDNQAYLCSFSQYLFHLCCFFGADNRWYGRC